MTRKLLPLVAALITGCAVSLAIAAVHYDTGPLPSKTGAPSVGGLPDEPNCTFCHQTFDTLGGRVNNLNLPGGYVEILDLPATYTAGQTYTLRVRLWSDSTVSAPMRRWGFQLTAVAASDGNGIGTFLLHNLDTLQIVPGEFTEPWTTRRYVEHKFAGIHDGEAGPAEWSLDWKAPNAPSGAVYFYVAGNAANGSLDPGGDFIYTAADTVEDITVPVRPVSWGALKTRWR